MRTWTLDGVKAAIRDPDVLAAGQKLVETGSFQNLEYTEDGSFYQGECRMGKRRYKVSADFQFPEKPVFQCTCSRTGSSCKHIAGFLCRLLDKQGFRQVPLSGEVEEMREERTVKEARRAAKARRQQRTGTDREMDLQRRLKGIALADQLRLDLVNTGLKSAAKDLLRWKERASQLEEYGLGEFWFLYQSLFNKLEGAARTGKKEDFGGALKTLEEIWTLTERGISCLEERRRQDGPGGVNSPLYGGADGGWSPETLAAAGHTGKNVRLAQLAFWQTVDKERSSYVQTGVWADLGSGELYVTSFLRAWTNRNPGSRDTVFGTVTVPELCIYPGNGNRRIVWREETPGALTPGDLSFLRTQAGNSLEKGIQAARTVLRDPLSEGMVFALFRYQYFGRVGKQPVVLDQSGIPIGLQDMPGMPQSTRRILELPDPDLLGNQVLLGGIWHERERNVIRIQPLSLLTETSVVRLLY